MIDTHTHLYLRDSFGSDIDEVMARAEAAGVAQMIFPGIDAASVAPMLELHARYTGCTHIAAGLHPTEVDADWRSEAEKCLAVLDSHRCVAVGEIGMDLYWDKTFAGEQREALAMQLREAYRRSLPAIIHCREALTETLEVMRELGDELPEIVFHSFTGSAADVERIRAVTDAMFGINGVVTFKNAATLREALPAIGTDRLMFETDSPYLAPVPHRGKRNESAWTYAVCNAVAGVFGLSPSEMEEITDRNARRFFGI